MLELASEILNSEETKFQDNLRFRSNLETHKDDLKARNRVYRILA